VQSRDGALCSLLGTEVSWGTYASTSGVCVKIYTVKRTYWCDWEIGHSGIRWENFNPGPLVTSRGLSPGACINTVSPSAATVRREKQNILKSRIQAIRASNYRAGFSVP